MFTACLQHRRLPSPNSSFTYTQHSPQHLIVHIQKNTHTLITSWARPHTSDPYTFQQIEETYSSSSHEHPAASPRSLHRHAWCNAARCRAHRTQTVARPWRLTKSCPQPCRRGMLLPLPPMDLSSSRVLTHYRPLANFSAHSFSSSSPSPVRKSRTKLKL
jgi:hypothetical protein